MGNFHQEDNPQKTINVITEKLKDILAETVPVRTYLKRRKSTRWKQLPKETIKIAITLLVWSQTRKKTLELNM